MSNSQSWTLSQEANKKRGVCKVCLEEHNLLLKDGTVRQHGKTGKSSNPCAGSYQLPHSIVPESLSRSSKSSASDRDTAGFNIVAEGTRASSVHTLPSTSVTHPTLSGATVKHIPRSARAVCATLLTNIFRRIEGNVEEIEGWVSFQVH